MAAEPSRDVESLLRSALRPIEPPEKLSGRVEETLSAVTEAAAEELSAWADGALGVGAPLPPRPA